MGTFKRKIKNIGRKKIPFRNIKGLMEREKLEIELIYRKKEKGVISLYLLGKSYQNEGRK